MQKHLPFIVFRLADNDILDNFGGTDYELVKTWPRGFYNIYINW